MDQRKLIAIVKQYPQIWDRNHPYFRDTVLKEKAWSHVADEIGYSKNSCIESFKSLQEKYIQECKKSSSEVYQEWELLNELKFLDPHILPRKPQLPTYGTEETTKLEVEVCPQPAMSTLMQKVGSGNPSTAFDLALISAVRQTTAIWDRSCHTYPNKPLKSQLWLNIATTLNKGINECMLRWKALREKYIRQKMKFHEGDNKWELLDELSFLDQVIQYRRKHSESEVHRNNTYIDTLPSGSNSSYHQNNTRYSYQSENTSSVEPDYSQIHIEVNDDDSYIDSNDFLSIVKQEGKAIQQMADSSYTPDTSYSRKRSASMNSESSGIEKRARNEGSSSHVGMSGKSPGIEKKKTEEKEKTPEQLFGDLVAVLLRKKPEKERNLYMIEIMTVLSK